MSTPVRKFGIAVLGLGRIGHIHTKSLLLNPRAKLKWIVDVEGNRPKAQSFGGSIQYAIPEQLDMVLKDSSVDAVVVCTPTSEHERLIKTSLDAGKAVFSEKPITADIDSTQACYERAEIANLPLFCAFHRRFDPSFMSVKSSLESQESGRLRMLRSSSHDPNPPPVEYIKKSGGILKDSTIHDLDMTLWMSGSPAQSVFVHGKAFDPTIDAAGDHDLVVVTIQHANGAVSVIDNGRRCAYGYDQRFEAICDNGSYTVTNRSMHQSYKHLTSASTMPPIDAGFLSRYPQAYENEMEHFLDALEGKTALKVTKQDTIGAMKLAEAAQLSAKSKKIVDL